MKYLFFCYCLFPLVALTQNVLVYGKQLPLEGLDSNISIHYSIDLPHKALASYDVILIFSTANSQLDLQDEAALEQFVKEGGGLYLGADNIPFVEECNQLTELFYNARFYGNFNRDTITASQQNNLKLKDNECLNSGETTTSFPLDYRLRVEAWSQDNPIILSGNFGKGRIILDGGYSRFYELESSKKILLGILSFLAAKGKSF